MCYIEYWVNLSMLWVNENENRKYIYTLTSSCVHTIITAHSMCVICFGLNESVEKKTGQTIEAIANKTILEWVAKAYRQTFQYIDTIITVPVSIVKSISTSCMWWWCCCCYRKYMFQFLTIAMKTLTKKPICQICEIEKFQNFFIMSEQCGWLPSVQTYYFSPMFTWIFTKFRIYIWCNTHFF